MTVFFFYQISHIRFVSFQLGIRVRVLSSNLIYVIHLPFKLNISRIGPHLFKEC